MAISVEEIMIRLAEVEKREAAQLEHAELINGVITRMRREGLQAANPDGIEHAIREYVKATGQSRAHAAIALSASQPKLFGAVDSPVAPSGAVDSWKASRIKSLADAHVAAHPEVSRTDAIISLTESHPDLFSEEK